MIVEPEQTVTASTVPAYLHNPAHDVSGRVQTLLIKNTSANGATIYAGNAAYDLAAGASLTISLLEYGQVAYAKRSGGSDATLSVLRSYSR